MRWKEDGKHRVSGAGVGGIVGLLEAIGGDVRVNLGGDEVSVAEKFLHAPKVRAGIEHVSGVAVAKFVWRELGIETAGFEIALEAELDQTGIHGPGTLSASKEHGHAGGGRVIEGAPIVVDSGQSLRADGDEPFLFAFAAHADHLFGPVNVLSEQAAEFADTKAAGVDGFENGDIAET